MNESRCPSHNALASLVAGGLDDASASGVLEHLETCADCRSTVDRAWRDSDPVARAVRTPIPDLGAEAPFQAAASAVADFSACLRRAAPETSSRKQAIDELPPRLGQYDLQRKLGEGGMGAVYLAQHVNLKRPVAVKVLPTGQMTSPHAVARFRREMEAAGRLSHPNIVTTHDAAEHDGVHFIVMEYVEGMDLSALVRQNGPLNVAEAIDYLVQAARGLEYAHQQGVVHRDVKPSNLLVDQYGLVRVLDMGLARLAETDPDDEGHPAELTQSGSVLGTVDYMSPEQATSSRDVTHLTDVYSLGCSLYFLLTGRATYPGHTMMEKLIAHREQPAPQLVNDCPGIAAELGAVFRRMVAKRPQDRYASMTELIAALEACRPAEPRPPFPPARSAQSSETVHGYGTIPAESPPVIASDADTAGNSASPADTASVQTTPDSAYETPTVMLPPTAEVPLEAPVPESSEELKPATKQFSKRLMLAVALPSACVVLAVAGLLFRPAANVPPEPGDGIVPDGPNSPATTSQLKRPTWKMGPPPKSDEPVPMPGLLPQPAEFEQFETFQVETRAPRGRIVSLDWSPDGRHLSCLSGDQMLRVFETDTWRVVRVFPLTFVPPVAGRQTWTPDGSHIIVPGFSILGMDGSVRGPLRTGVNHVACNPQTGNIAASTAQGVHLYDFEGAQQLQISDQGVHGLCWSPDGEWLALRRDRTLSLWHRDQPEPLLLNENLSNVTCDVVWSPDSAIVGATRSNQLHLWTTDGQPVRDFSYGVTSTRSAHWSRDGEWIAFAQDSALGSRIHLSRPDGQQGHVIERDDVPAGDVVAWSPDGSRLASGGGRVFNALRIWKTDGTLDFSLVGPGSRGDQSTGDGRFGGVRAAAVAPNGTQFATALDDRTLRLWSIDGEPQTQLTGHEFAFTSLDWSADGTRLAAGGRAETNSLAHAVYIWNRDQWNAPQRLDGDLGAAIAWHPLEDLFATGTSEGEIRLVKPDGSTSQVLVDGLSGIQSLDWSPDGEWLAAVDSTSERVHLYRRDGKPGPAPPSELTYCATWSPKGQWLGLGHRLDNLLWSPESGAGPASERVGYQAGAHHLAWSGDGQRFVTAELNRIRVFRSNGTLDRLLETRPSVTRTLQWAPSERIISAGTDSAIVLWSLDDHQPHRVIVPLPEGESVTLSGAGEILHSSSPMAEEQLVYITKEHSGEYVTQSVQEFRERVAADGVP